MTSSLTDVNWERVERLSLRAFTGGGLSEEEFGYLQMAFNFDRAEYTKRTRAVREAERARIKAM